MGTASMDMGELERGRAGERESWRERGGAAAAVGMGVTVDPAVTIFSSAPVKSGETTTVVEVERVDHLDIVKHPYVHSLVFENLLSLMAKELAPLKE